MFPARFPLWLIAPLLGSLLWPTVARAQGNRLFPSKAPQYSDALRAAPRRTPPPARPDTVDLPYHMLWGDSMNRLASLFAGVGAKIADKKTEGGTETWTVQGLLAANLENSFFKFSSGQLAALEFDYGSPEWDTAKYNEQMGQFRRLLEAKCEAPGEIISRKNDDVPDENGVKETLMGYQWKRGDTLVQLFYFSAEDPAKSLTYRTISLHYYYQDPTPAAPDVPLPENSNADPNASALFGGKGVGATPLPVANGTPTPIPAPTPPPEIPWEVSPDVPPSPSPTAPPPIKRNGRGKPPTAPTESDPLPQ